MPLLALVGIALDQALKYFAQTLGFTPVYTATLAGTPLPRLAAVIISAGALTLIGIAATRPRWRHLRPAFLFIIAGGAGNLLDRILYGAVIDIFSISTLTFNVADMLVVGGVIALLYSVCLPAVRNSHTVGTG